MVMYRYHILFSHWCNKLYGGLYLIFLKRVGVESDLSPNLSCRPKKKSEPRERSWHSLRFPEKSVKEVLLVQHVVDT